MKMNCDTCGEQFTAARGDARYCSGRCRTIAYRKRNNLEPAQPRRRRPLPEAFHDTAWDIFKKSERLERLVADDRFARNREVLIGYDRRYLEMARDRINAALAELSQDD